MNLLKDLAIIIPVAPKENAWRSLLKDLKDLPSETEILLVGPNKPPNFERFLRRLSHSEKQVDWIDSPLGRARQLNLGAQHTQKKFLWFLHADSRLPSSSFPALEKALITDPHALYYLNLRFLDDGPPLTKINAVGVWIRSHWLSLPFGDQGFCITKTLFELLGQFPEDAPYGEDHLFVWSARRAGIPVRSVSAKIYTSSRKYRKNGWAKTTIRHGIYTIKQAFPEWMKLLTSQRGAAK